MLHYIYSINRAYKNKNFFLLAKKVELEMKRQLIQSKAGKTSTGLSSPVDGLRESNQRRHYSDTTHNYGNFFEARPRNDPS